MTAYAYSDTDDVTEKANIDRAAVERLERDPYGSIAMTADEIERLNLELRHERDVRAEAERGCVNMAKEIKRLAALAQSDAKQRREEELREDVRLGAALRRAQDAEDRLAAQSDAELGKGDFARYVEQLNREHTQSDAEDMALITKIRDYEAPPLPDDADRPLGFRTNDVPNPYAEGPVPSWYETHDDKDVMPDKWSMTDAEPVAWERALNSACHQFESYVRQEKLTTPEDRRVALSDALQHAVGLLKITAPPRPDAPGHTDLMVRPETLDAFMEANPLPPDDKAADEIERLAAALAQSDAEPVAELKRRLADAYKSNRAAWDGLEEAEKRIEELENRLNAQSDAEPVTIDSAREQALSEAYVKGFEDGRTQSDAEPVKYEYRRHPGMGDWIECGKANYNANPEYEYRPLYTAPPRPDASAGLDIDAAVRAGLATRNPAPDAAAGGPPPFKTVTIDGTTTPPRPADRSRK